MTTYPQVDWRIRLQAEGAGIIAGSLVIESEVDEAGEYTGEATLLFPDGARFDVAGMIGQPYHPPAPAVWPGGHLPPPSPQMALDLHLRFAEQPTIRVRVRRADERL